MSKFFQQLIDELYIDNYFCLYKENFMNIRIFRLLMAFIYGSIPASLSFAGSEMRVPANDAPYCFTLNVNKEMGSYSYEFSPLRPWVDATKKELFEKEIPVSGRPTSLLLTPLYSKDELAVAKISVQSSEGRTAEERAGPENYYIPGAPDSSLSLHVSISDARRCEGFDIRIEDPFNSAESFSSCVEAPSASEKRSEFKSRFPIKDENASGVDALICIRYKMFDLSKLAAENKIYFSGCPAGSNGLYYGIYYKQIAEGVNLDLTDPDYLLNFSFLTPSEGVASCMANNYVLAPNLRKIIDENISP